MRNCLVPSKCRKCGPRANNRHAGPLHKCFSRLRSVAGGAAEPACAKEDVKGTPHQENDVQLVSLKAKSINHNVLLRTSAVRVINPRTGKLTLAYAQHDTASQATLVSKRLIEELKLDINTDYNLTIRTLADQITVSKGLVTFTLQSLTSNEYFDVEDVLVVPEFMEDEGALPHSIDVKHMKHFKGVEIPTLSGRRSIDILI